VALQVEPGILTGGRPHPERTGGGRPAEPVRVLVVTAVAAERDAVVRGLAGPSVDGGPAPALDAPDLSGADGPTAGAEEPTTGADGPTRAVRPTTGVDGPAGRPDWPTAEAEEPTRAARPTTEPDQPTTVPLPGYVLRRVTPRLGRGLTPGAEQRPAHRALHVDVVAAGVGPAAAASATATALTAAAVAGTPYRLAVSAGIGGGFAHVAVGSVVIADAIVAADLGAETPAGFAAVTELGFGTIEHRPPVRLAYAAARAAGAAAAEGGTGTGRTGA
jgi:hypothetical protein